MSEIKTCPYCNNNLSNRGFFCASCGKQVKCKSCLELLELNASACVYCGTKITEEALKSEASFSKNDDNKHLIPLNTFEYRETRNSKVLKASFTDAIGNSLNETLNNFVGNRMLNYRCSKFSRY